VVTQLRIVTKASPLTLFTVAAHFLNVSTEQFYYVKSSSC